MGFRGTMEITRKNTESTNLFSSGIIEMDRPTRDLYRTDLEYVIVVKLDLLVRPLTDKSDLSLTLLTAFQTLPSY